MIGLALKLGGWVRGNPVTAALAGVIIAFSLSLFVTSMRLKSARDHLAAMTALRDGEAASHRATKAHYAQAQAEAAFTHEATKLAIETHWKDVVHDTESTLRARLDDALGRARLYAGGLRPAHPGGTGVAGATGQAQPAPTAPATARAGGAGEGHQVHVRVPAQHRTGLVTVAVHDVQHARRNARFQPASTDDSRPLPSRNSSRIRSK